MPAESFEAPEAAAPVSVQSATACTTFPRARLLSNRAAHFRTEKAHFRDGDHCVNAAIALPSAE
jgi:hypothetical protein